MGHTSSNAGFKTFPQGGIHPPDNKITADKPVTVLPLPKQVVLPLGQHIGAPAKVLVKVGDKVKVGQLIAEAAGFISANIHASVSGSVKKIDDVIDVSGYKKPAIWIDVEGDEWLETIDMSPGVIADLNVEPSIIVERIKAAGIVGLGGAAFPTHVKLIPAPGKNLPEVLLINAVECEPYLTSDHRVMLEHPQEVVMGVKLLMKAAGIKKAFIGVEANKMDAVDILTRYASVYKDITVSPLQMLYPQGGERQLVKALTGKEIPPPPKGLPIDVGAIVINVATCFAVYQAVLKARPLVDRVVTFTGAALKNAGNFRVRFGTSVAHLLEHVGGMPDDTSKITSGGPMMGRAFADLDVPVTKGMSGFVVYAGKDGLRGELTNCIRCGKCVTVCPLGLEPYLVAGLTERGRFERLEEERILNCCDCGCCAYICPANRPLLDYIKLGKGKVLNIMKKRAAAGGKS